MKVVSWHPVLTDHQSYTLEALQQAGKCDLKVYVANMVHVERQAQGWVNKHTSLLSPELIPKKGWFRLVIQRLREHQDAVHLFGSPFEQKKLIIVLLLAVALGHRVYLISEPYSPISVGYQNDRLRFINWFKAKLRPLLYSLYGVLLRHRINGVFAISCLAVEQYQRIGIIRRKIFPFGYFIPYHEPANTVNSSTHITMKTDLKLVFIGNLIDRKGLDILVNAVRELNNNGLSFSLDIYGPGVSGQYSFDKSSMRYCGLIPFGDSQLVISEYDLLVLPSRYDGWGVVVNEALMAGVPVICSDHVGASAVIEKWQCGTIFESENVSDLASKLESLLNYPDQFNNMRLAARKASSSLEPKIAGQYMNDIINQKSVPIGTNKQIDCPWYECK
jgi:glycosyltransferase involved in cell wall biosynthesis